MLPILNQTVGGEKVSIFDPAVHPNVLAGMSPPGRLFAPEGWVGTGSNRRWVEARIIYSHNQPADPRRQICEETQPAAVGGLCFEASVSGFD